MSEWKERKNKLALLYLEKTVKQFSASGDLPSFISRVLTESERIAIGRRLAVARMILEGQTYFEICEKLNISPNTFRNIRKWIIEEMPGYNEVLEENKKVTAEKNTKKRGQDYIQTQPFSMAGLKQRYPGHFLLFNLADELMSYHKRKRVMKKLK